VQNFRQRVQFAPSINSRLVHKFFVRILPTNARTWSATFWSADYPFIGPQVRILPIAGRGSRSSLISIPLKTTLWSAFTYAVRLLCLC